MPTELPRARKRFGQHFLERAWADKVVQAIGPTAAHTVVEIGPGRGALTSRLTAAAGRVVAVEIDRDLAALLHATAPTNLTVVEGDFLTLPAERLIAELPPGTTSVRVAGNLPYNVASPILVRLVDLYAAGLPLADATVMLQREVADRILAPVGTKDYSPLTILVRQWAAAAHLLALPPGAFRPAPKVHSAVLRLTFHPPDPATADAAAFRRLVLAVFSQRRKMLSNTLLAYEPRRDLAARALAEAGIDGRRRPETLTMSELGRLFEAVGPAHAHDVAPTPPAVL